MGYPFNFQLDSYDCGPACLQMLARFYGKQYSIDSLRERSFITRNGVSLLGISQAAEELGCRTLMAKVDLETLQSECPLPAILHWNQDHFVVLYNIRRRFTLNPFRRKQAPLRFVVADPGKGIFAIDESSFCKSWLSGSEDAKHGIALFLEPTAAFYDKEGDKVVRAGGIRFLLRYLIPFKRQIWTLVFFMVLSTLISISFPYLTKSTVDKGLPSKSYSLVLLFAVSQLVLFLGSVVLDILRSWLLLHMNTRISLHIVSDFLKKLLKLPIRFFDSKSIGDISQRITDHHRIENFLTGDTINSVFSILQILVFSFILLYYSALIWIIFIALSLSGVLWIFLFQKKREKLDYIRFSQSKNIQEKLYELIVGMQEIKLYGSEDNKRWEWEFMQQRLYKLNIKGLIVEQYRQTGFSFLTYFKNIIISYLAAVGVIEGRLTLGTMLSISFIIGQTNGPLQQLIAFFKSAQDANLSLDRLQEVHKKVNEENEVIAVQGSDPVRKPAYTGSRVIAQENIYLENVSFQYQGPRSQFVLKDIDLTIPKGKITALVGASGSGKTTLMKLLLGFYQPVQGRILVGNRDLASLSPAGWRSQCGTVMQDGYIFNDTITKNIALDGQPVDAQRMDAACAIGHINEFTRKLPMGCNTRVGNNGIGLSGGQKQRILIARAVYKDPYYLFFDEATSSLDANNEKMIMDELNEFFYGKTVVIIAHRLSTVKNADKIVVLNNGEIIESGTHAQLTTDKGKYYQLVKNQLEI